MKLFNLILAILLANITTANLLPKSPLPYHLDPPFPDVKSPNGVEAAHLAAPPPPVSKTDLWRTSVARGRKLLQGMHSADSVAATLFNLGSTAESPFDGPGATTFATWGYNENAKQHARVDKECDFAAYHKLARTFADLGMGTQSKGAGGPNECFVVNHRDGPAVKRNWRGKVPEVEKQRYEVCGVEYRATDATHTLGINPSSGAVFIMNILSAAHSARRLWRTPPTPDQLPHLRSVSDIAWTFWRRATSPATHSVANIRYLFVTVVMNDETARLIEKAHAGLTPPRSGPGVWPGTEFGMDGDAGAAILGSPVGRWAGYFLMQHKRQLGGNKFISKVRVFKPENHGPYSYLLFYVAGPVGSAPPPVGAVGSGGDTARVVGLSEDGRKIVREHVISRGDELVYRDL